MILRNKIIRLFCCCFIILLLVIPVSWASNIEIKPSPNYLILLVHGIASRGACFGHGDADDHHWEDDEGEQEPYGDLAYFLKNDLGMDGYVYAYSFSDNLQSSITSARELGDRSYYNNPAAPRYLDISRGDKIKTNKCMLDQARADFINWYHDSGPGSKFYPKRYPTEAEIPKKFVIIAHSMGGLAVRSYLTSSFYQNDVVKVVFIDTPHIGADGLEWYKRFKFDYGFIRSLHGQLWDYVMRIIFNYVTQSFGNPPMESLYVAAANMSLGSGANFLDTTLFDLCRASELMNVNNSLAAGFSLNAFGIPKVIADLPKTIADQTSKIGQGLVSGQTDSLAGDYAKQEAAGLLAALLMFQKWEGVGLNEMEPNSSFISSLKVATPQGQVDPIKYRLISARGCPTPDKNLISRYYGLNPYAIGMFLPLMSEYNSLPSESAKMYSALTSLALPGIFAVKDGSLLVALDSSRGDGVKIFNDNTKRYEYLAVPQSYELIAKNAKAASDACVAAYWVLSLIPGFQFNPSILSALLYYNTAMLSKAQMVGLREHDVWENMLATHGFIIKNAYRRENGNMSIIDQALDDTPFLGGTANTPEVKSITASALSTPTASYSAPDQRFALLSNLDAKGQKVSNYHTVTIETFNPGNANAQQLAPIVIDGKKQWIDNVTVKEAPTAIKGVINTFLPKKLKSFQYSENFAVWKNVGTVDKWGNFVVKDLKLGEGQNVIAFRAESWTGNKMNQLLKITLNTIPCVPGNFYPLSGSYTNNSRQKAWVKFYKSKYKAKSKGFQVLVCSLDGQAVTPEVTTGTTDYQEWIKVEIRPKQALAEGEHRVRIKVQSDVGVSQALWTFVVDTIAPSLRIEPIKPISFRRLP